MAEEGTHLARKWHHIGPLRSTAHPKKFHEENTQRSERVLKENLIQFQSIHPVGARVRCKDGAKIYESTEEVAEDLVRTLLIERRRG